MSRSFKGSFFAFTRVLLSYADFDIGAFGNDVEARELFRIRVSVYARLNTFSHL